MADNKPDTETVSEEIAQSPGMRTVAINSDPTISLEEARNAAAGESPNAAGGPAQSSAEDYVPSRSDPYPSNIPSTDHPLPDDAENPNEETIGSSLNSSEKTDERYTH